MPDNQSDLNRGGIMKNQPFIVASLSAALLIALALNFPLDESVAMSGAAALSFAGVFAFVFHRSCVECPHAVLRLWAIQGGYDIVAILIGVFLASVDPDVTIALLLLVVLMAVHTCVIISAVVVVIGRKDPIDRISMCYIFGSHAFAAAAFLTDT